MKFLCPNILFHNYLSPISLSLLSLSFVANELNLVEPELVQEKVIEIKKGRHPFIEHCSNSMVPNDYVSSIEKSMIKIITGPSAAGKSVYCKQVSPCPYKCILALTIVVKIFSA